MIRAAAAAALLMLAGCVNGEFAQPSSPVVSAPKQTTIPVARGWKVELLTGELQLKSRHVVLNPKPGLGIPSAPGADWLDTRDRNKALGIVLVWTWKF